MVIRALIASLLLAGCALLEPHTQDAVAADRALAEALAAARASPAEQKAALAAVQAAFVKDSSTANRLRLATLVALLPPPLRDDARAGELLQPLSREATPPGRFAALLAGHVAERQRLSREAERLAREADRVARDHERSDKERDRREEELRKQLEAMQSIERAILEREEKLRRRPR
jgi:hypothetical protein